MKDAGPLPLPRSHRAAAVPMARQAAERATLARGQGDRVLPAHHPSAAEREPIGMKIAAVSEDGVTVAQHFGRAPYYVVVTVEEGRVVDRETRTKVGLQDFAGGGGARAGRGSRQQ